MLAGLEDVDLFARQEAQSKLQQRLEQGVEAGEVDPLQVYQELSRMRHSEDWQHHHGFLLGAEVKKREREGLSVVVCHSCWAGLCLWAGFSPLLVSGGEEGAQSPSVCPC